MTSEQRAQEPECPWPESMDEIRIDLEALFPNVTVLIPPPRVVTDSVLAAGHIGSQRQVMENHNTQKNKNVIKAENEIKSSVVEYNEKLEEARIRCRDSKIKNE